MSTSESTLPLELLDLVIQEFWSMPLAPKDRISFMTTSLLVNKYWATSFLRISSIDVHIPSVRYLEVWYSFLRRHARLFKILPKAERFPHLCQSINIQIRGEYGNHIPQDDGQGGRKRHHPMTIMTAELLATLGEMISVPPHLRRLSIQYHNRLYDEKMDLCVYEMLPPCFTELDIEYTFDARTPAFLVEGLQSKTQISPYFPWYMPSVRKLSILGANEGMVKDILWSCPNLEDFVTSDYVKLDQHLSAFQSMARRSSLNTLESRPSRTRAAL